VAKGDTSTSADGGGPSSAFSEALDFVSPSTGQSDDHVAFDEARLGQSNSVFADGQVIAVPSAPNYPAPVGPMQAPPPMMVPQGRVISTDDLSSREVRRRTRLQARKVRRIIRHIEPWSVFKVSLLFYLCLWVILVLAGVLLWSVALRAGTIDTVTEFVKSLGAAEDFGVDGTVIFRVYTVAGLVLAIAGTAFNVLLCVLFNLISDLMGGIRLTVIEEESARFRPPRRRRR